MINQIEKLKQKINEAKAANGDWNTPYQELMKAVYNSSVLFFALSRNEYNPETVESVPLISTKDFGGLPALYVFTDVNTASDWMDHYKHFTDDKEYGLIGAAEKNISSNFYSIFQIARCLGTKMIVLDEGASLVGIDIDSFLSANNIDAGVIEYVITNEEAENLVRSNAKPVIKFVGMKAIPLTK